MDISSGIATVTGLSKLTKLIINGKVDAKAKEIASELYDSILPLQQMLSSLHSENLSLQIEKSNITKEVSKLNDWKEKASKYELKALAPGVFVRSYIQNVESTEPPHHICEKCYEEDKAYILNASEIKTSGIHYLCPSCDTTIIDYSNKKEIQPQHRPRGNWMG